MTVFGKGGKTRTVLLKPKTYQLLIAFRKESKSLDPVFRSEKQGHLTENDIWRIIKKAAAVAGINPKASPHWLRHSHASHAIENGAPLHLVRDILGHASIQTTSQYLHARPGG